MAATRRGFSLLALVRWLFLAFMLAFTALPMIWMFSTSIKTEFASIQQPPVWIPAEPTIEQYTRLLSPADETGRAFLGYLRDRTALPAWERPNMIAKYMVTTGGTAMSRTRPASSGA